MKINKKGGLFFYSPLHTPLEEHGRRKWPYPPLWRLRSFLPPTDSSGSWAEKGVKGGTRGKSFSSCSFLHPSAMNKKLPKEGENGCFVTSLFSLLHFAQYRTFFAVFCFSFLPRPVCGIGPPARQRLYMARCRGSFLSYHSSVVLCHASPSHRLMTFLSTILDPTTRGDKGLGVFLPFCFVCLFVVQRGEKWIAQGRL